LNVEPKRILITGANGFVGRHLIDHLLRGHESSLAILAAVRPEEANDPGLVPPAAGWTGGPLPQVTIVPLDLLDAAGTTETVRRARPDVIVHLAARASGADTDREAINAVNVEGTRAVLEGAALCSPFSRAVVVSTGYVYGNTDCSRPAREDDPIGPLWRFGPYTDSKIDMESVARNYRAFTVIARPFSHTGPGQLPAFAVPAFARQLARIERGLDPPILRVGNLSSYRDILDVRDVVRAYALLADVGEAGRVYNVATGAPVMIGDVLDRLRSQCRARTTIETDPARMRAADIECSSGDPLRTWTETNWSPRFPLNTTLTDTLDYWRGLV
jgi:GDP-4-dehydro-6-deoxy-D-mannose reductase